MPAALFRHSAALRLEHYACWWKPMPGERWPQEWCAFQKQQSLCTWSDCGFVTVWAQCFNPTCSESCAAWHGPQMLGAWLESHQSTSSCNQDSASNSCWYNVVPQWWAHVVEKYFGFQRWQWLGGWWILWTHSWHAAPLGGGVFPSWKRCGGDYTGT